jgi:hypothetical protein
MADAVDRANDLAQTEIDAIVRNRPSAKLPPGHGHCLYCDEPLDPPRRWCDADCRDDFEKAVRAEQQRPLG